MCISLYLLVGKLVSGWEQKRTAIMQFGHWLVNSISYFSFLGNASKRVMLKGTKDQDKEVNKGEV